LHRSTGSEYRRRGPLTRPPQRRYDRRVSSSGENTTSIPSINEPYPIRPVEIVLGHLERVHRSGKGWKAGCTAPVDRTPSKAVIAGQRAHEPGWKEKMGAAADHLEGMFNPRRRYGHKV